MMAAQRKTRTLRLADGGLFRIGPGTVSVPVSTMTLDPPALLLHINRSCGALELVPHDDGTTPPPVRVDAARVVAIVEQINAERQTAAIRGGRAEPLVELPPKFSGTARHVAAWKQHAFPFILSTDAAGYPGKLPTSTNTTLWVERSTGRTVLEVVHPPRPGEIVRYADTKEIPAADAVAWMLANGYRLIPATLHRLARTGSKGAADETRPRKRS